MSNGWDRQVRWDLLECLEGFDGWQLRGVD